MHPSSQPFIHPVIHPSLRASINPYIPSSVSLRCSLHPLRLNPRIHRCALLRGGSQTYCKVECVNLKSSGCQFKVILRSSRSHQRWMVDFASSDWTHTCQCKTTFTAMKALDNAVVRQKILEHGRNSDVSYVHLSIHIFIYAVHPLCALSMRACIYPSSIYPSSMHLSIHPFMPSIHYAHYPCPRPSIHSSIDSLHPYLHPYIHL